MDCFPERDGKMIARIGQPAPDGLLNIMNLFFGGRGKHQAQTIFSSTFQGRKKMLGQKMESRRRGENTP